MFLNSALEGNLLSVRGRRLLAIALVFLAFTFAFGVGFCGGCRRRFPPIILAVIGMDKAVIVFGVLKKAFGRYWIPR